jgi:hypothetical protein
MMLGDGFAIGRRIGVDEIECRRGTLHPFSYWSFSNRHRSPEVQ